MFSFTASQLTDLRHRGLEFSNDGTTTTATVGGHSVRVTSIPTDVDARGFTVPTTDGDTLANRNGVQTEGVFFAFEESGPLGWLPLIGAPVEGTDAERYALAAYVALTSADVDDDDDDDDDDEPRSMWDCDEEVADISHDISVPGFVSHHQSPTVSTVAAIVQGGCDSGAFMPAVTYWQALETMDEFGDDVLAFVEDGAGVTPPTGLSWAGLACWYVSVAVETWAHQVAWELHEEHGFEEAN